MPRDFFVRSLRDLMHWSSLRSILRTYERSTCSKPSILFTDTKSRQMKKRTTPIYATCTSPIMHLICPPKFCISIIFNFSWDGCNIQEKWKTTWKVMQNFGGANKVHYGRCASDESSYLNRTSLVNKVFMLLPNNRGLYSQRFVLLLFSILRVGRPPRHWFISFSSLPFPVSFASTLNVPMVFLSFARNPTSN